MRCTSCRAELRTTQTDLPFKVNQTAIVILKNLPVLQCVKCPEYLIEVEVLRRVEEILARVEGGTELEIIRYAARSSGSVSPKKPLERMGLSLLAQPVQRTVPMRGLRPQGEGTR